MSGVIPHILAEVLFAFVKMVVTMMLSPVLLTLYLIQELKGD